MRTEIVTLKRAGEIMHDLTFQDQARIELTEKLSYTGLLDRLREIASANATSFVFHLAADDKQVQLLKRIRRNQGAGLGDMTVYAVMEVRHA